MAARISKLVTRAERMEEETAAQLRQLLLEFPGLPERARGEIVAVIDRRAPSQGVWPFVMISAEQNVDVVQWLCTNSTRPKTALAVWALLFTAMRRDTGEVVLTRDEIAERLGTSPSNVSHVLGELERLNAVIRRREPAPGVRGKGSLRIFVNPLVGTHLTGAARDRAQAAAPRLRLVETEPG
jgi:CRP-like cAMP-binding protein